MQTISNLIPFAKPLISLPPTASLEEIQTLMIAKEISMVPLVDGLHGGFRNIGLVRRKSIWLWMLNDPTTKPMVKDVRENALPEVSPEEDLTSAMKKLNSASALLLRQTDNRLTHYISPKIIAIAFQDYAEKFQYLERLESRIRNQVAVLPNNIWAAAIPDQTCVPENVNSLTFAQYHAIFSKCWDQLDFGYLERRTVLKLIDEAREYRNRVMHFRLTEDDKGLNAVRELTNLLK